MDEIIFGLIAALVGGVSGSVSALLTNVIERRKVIDESVREIRTARYTEPWRASALLRSGRGTRAVTYEDVPKLSEGFRAWYFGTEAPPTPSEAQGSRAREPTAPAAPDPGGMYLSSRPERPAGRFRN